MNNNENDIKKEKQKKPTAEDMNIASTINQEIRGLKTFAEQKAPPKNQNRRRPSKPKVKTPEQAAADAVKQAEQSKRDKLKNESKKAIALQKTEEKIVTTEDTAVQKAKKPTANKPNNRKKSVKDDGKKLKIISLGGLQEIGKNMTVFEYDNDIIVVDCGMTFPNGDMLGVDLVIPDTTYLKKNINKIRGIVITHGHEDHIGGLPYVLRDLNVPIYCTALAGGIIKNKLEEHKNLKKAKLNIKKAGDIFKLGAFEIEMIHVNHSIADAVALSIGTPLGKCIFMGDFKIDTTPVDGHFIDLARFGQLGNEGVLMLMSDSTNAERPGMAMSEMKVGRALEEQFKNCDKRILVATFSSNIHRIQQIFEISQKYNRKVCISGRSMENMVKVGIELGFLKFPKGLMVDISMMKKYPKEQMTVITTGSQGEPMSALMRMSMGSHKQIHISTEDKILMSASPIPGNEKGIYTLINELVKRGAEVVYDKLAELHVSGHACSEELKMILALTKPKYFMPVHGEYRHLVAHAAHAKAVGIAPENIFISEIGKVLEINGKSARINGSVPAGKVLVDGLGVGDVGQTVLRDRQHLSQDGLIIIVTTFDADSATVAAGPDIITRGINLTKDTEDISEKVRGIASETIENCLEKNLSDWATIKSEMRANISDYVYKHTKRNPMILPINMEV